MPSFKPKSAKKIKISKKNSTTLDGKHKEFLNESNEIKSLHSLSVSVIQSEEKEKSYLYYG